MGWTVSFEVDVTYDVLSPARAAVVGGSVESSHPAEAAEVSLVSVSAFNEHVGSREFVSLDKLTDAERDWVNALVDADAQSQ